MLTPEQVNAFQKLAAKIRMGAIRAIAESDGHSGHLGGSMSICDLLAVLYGGVMDVDPKQPQKFDRDTFVLSKGHTAPALYGALAAAGFFPGDVLSTMNYGGTSLPSHADRLKVPGVDVTAGSLGQGLSIAVGITLANQIAGCDKYTYCVIGDGEAQEGQIWEAAMYAAHRKLDHLITFIDFNKKQLDGYVKDVCDLGNPDEKFQAFGWYVQRINGHDMEQIYDATTNAKAHKGQPSFIVLDTIKGKDALEFEEMMFNHAVPVSVEQYESLKHHFSAELSELSRTLNFSNGGGN